MGVEQWVIVPLTNGSAIVSPSAFCHCTECVFVSDIDRHHHVNNSTEIFFCWIVLWYNIVNIYSMFVPISWYDCIVIKIVQLKQENVLLLLVWSWKLSSLSRSERVLSYRVTLAWMLETDMSRRVMCCTVVRDKTWSFFAKSSNKACYQYYGKRQSIIQYFRMGCYCYVYHNTIHGHRI